jgi:CRISPR/Cas system-associated exonuclease Cas4 (RecB family)
LSKASSDEGLNDDAITKSDTMIFGDVHGRLDLFIQNLYTANLINAEGNWKGKNKNCIILGDVVSRGPYSTETIIYLESLKKQAEENGAKFEILMGNHEHCILNFCEVNYNNIKNIEVVRKIISESIQNDTIKASYADNNKNIICVHAGVEKNILKWAISCIDPKLREQLYNERNISSRKIYQIMKDNNITVEDVAKWMNETFKKDLSWRAPLLAEHPVDGQTQGIINSRKKTLLFDKYRIDEKKTYKATQFLGHTTTSYYKNFKNATSFGAFKKVNHNFYLDYDLLRGNVSFAAIQGNKIYQVYSRENGLNEKIKSSDKTFKLPESSMNTIWYLYRNAKSLDMSKWEVNLIATLPINDTSKKNTLQESIAIKEEASKVRDKMLKKSKLKELLHSVFFR